MLTTTPPAWISGRFRNFIVFAFLVAAIACAQAALLSTPAFAVDTTPPQVEITAPANDLHTNALGVNVEFTATDAESGVAACNMTSGDYFALDPGDNLIEVSCADNSSNVGSASIVVHVDRIAPTLTPISPAAGTVVGGTSVIVDYAVSDNDDPTPTCDYPPGSSAPLPDEGLNVVVVTCVDRSGNQGELVFDVVRDTTGPAIDITAPANDSTTGDSQPVLHFSASDPNGVGSCDKADGDPLALDPGANTITVGCVDQAGNSSSASVTVYRDATPPDVTLTAPADGSLTNAPSGEYAFTAVDAQVGPSGETAVTCDHSAGEAYSLDPGQHMYTLNCTDSYGNSASAGSTVTYDPDPPQITISDPADGTITAADQVTLSFTVDDMTGTTCDRQSGDSVSLADGSNTISVTCTDDASNSATATVGAYRDVQDPSVSITSPADGALTSTSPATIEFTATDDSGAEPSCDQTSGAQIPLTEGDNALSVTCTDSVGHSTTVTHHVTYDATAPSLGFQFDPSSPVVVATDTYELHYDASDANGIASCTIADGAVLVLDPGANSFTLTCTDNAGLSSSQPLEIVRDQTPPTLTIDTPVDGSTTGASSVLLNYTAQDALSQFSCDPAGSDIPVPVQAGPNVISVTCTDEAGNATTESVTVHRDATPPQIELTAPADGSLTNVASGEFAYTAVDQQVGPNGDTAVTCDHAAGEPYSLDPGLNSFTLTCTDSYGNQSSATANVNYDPYPPQITIGAPADNLLTAASQVTLDFTVDDAAATCDRQSGDAVPLAAEGQNTISVTCTDAAGNQSTQSVNVTRDTTAPQITITGPAAGTAFSAASAQIHYTTSDAHGPVSCDVADGGDIALTSEGENVLTVTCQDALGNSASASRTVVRDTIAPAVTISSPVDGSATNSSHATLHFSVSDATATTCSMHDGDALTYTLGNNTTSVACTDAAGNTGSASAGVLYDTATPTVSITFPSSGLITKAASVSPAYTAADDSGQVDCTPQSGAAFALNEGANTFTVSCADKAGNGASASIEIIRDSTPPTVDVTAPADNLLTNAASATLHFTKSDATYTTCNAADGQSLALNEGDNTISIECDDSAGNSTAISRTVTRDSTPPAIVITSPADSSSTESDSTAVSFTATDAHSAHCDRVSGASSALAIGSNAITVTCTDDAGNAGSATVHVTRSAPGGSTPAQPTGPTPQRVTRSGAFSQKKLSGLLKLSFVPPAGASGEACAGSASVTITISGVKKPIRTTARYTGDSHICTAKRTIKLSRKYKRKKAKAAIAFPGNAWVLPFTQKVSFKIK